MYRGIMRIVGARGGTVVALACIAPVLLAGCSNTTGPGDSHEDTPGMILVPAGSFMMGDGAAACGQAERDVTLTRDFYLGEHEVTDQEYMEALQWAYDHGYVTATVSSVSDGLDGSTVELLDLDSSYGCEIQFDGAGTFYLRESPSAHAQSAYPSGYDPADHPVKVVTWYGAARYCDWLSLQADLPRAYEHSGDWLFSMGHPYDVAGYRLPTDAEWEYAGQWDDERIYPWGDEPPDCTRANYSGCVGWTAPVGSYPDAHQALGLSDMAGNVLEFSNDWWSCDLGTASVTDPVGPESGSARVIQGGSWRGVPEYLACAYRNYYATPSFVKDCLGLRVARTASP